MEKVLEGGPFLAVFPDFLLSFSLGARPLSLQGDIVLGTFGGSGSTLITCEQLGRSCYTMELDPKYADVIVKRWLKFTGTDRAELVRDGKKRIVEANVF